MKGMTKRLFLISFILAVIASAAIFIYLKSLNQNDNKVETTNIIVAAETIPPRTVINKEMINIIEVPSKSVYGNFVTDEKEIIGKYSRQAILKDERFHIDKLIDEKEELSMRIHGNHRALSINVTKNSGVADLIKVGDYVDIILYLNEIKESGRIIRPDMAKLIKQNVEILAIDKNMYRDDKTRELPECFLVTLSIPIFDVEKIVLAQEIGRIELALRPLDGDYMYESEGTIWQELLLDDLYRIKDFYPEYKVRPVPQTRVSDGQYTYDKYKYYTVQYGDTLGKISEKFYGTPDNYILIQQVNRIKDEDEIVTGTGIKIPILE